MKKFISFSGGVESTAMCILFGGQAEAIFSDTGFEHDEMYQRIELVEKIVGKLHPGFKVHKIRNEKHGSLPEYIREKNTILHSVHASAQDCLRLNLLIIS